MVDQEMKDVLATRYASSAMREIWDARSKVIAERRFWIAVMKAQAQAGIEISETVIARYESAVENVDLDSIVRREKKSRHDVKARIEEFNELAGAQSIHLGMTSRDLTETVEMVQIRESLELIRDYAIGILKLLALRAEEYRDLAIVGRSHNVPAQLTTLGKRFATYLEELIFAFERLENLIERLPLRGIRGPMGTGQDMQDLLGAASQNLDHQVTRDLGFVRELDSTGQIYPRSIDFEVISTLVQLSAAPSSFATSLRLMAGAGLVSEGFQDGQVGSSAMPHKNNARTCERINGLNVVLHGYLSMIGQIAGHQWNEGDVSCSVVRRVSLPGSFFALDGIFQSLATVLKEMEVFRAAIEVEIKTQLPFISTTKLMTEAVKSGMGREDAHKLIQRYSLKALERMRSGESFDFFEELAADSNSPFTIEFLRGLISQPHSLTGRAGEQVDKVLAKAKTIANKYRDRPQVDFETVI